jgi:hypothetical protein
MTINARSGMKTIRTINIAFILAALLLMGVPATSSMADVFSANRALPGVNLHPGDTFDVTVSFSAPDDDFNAIGITDVAPTGWAISVNTAWCTPAATYGNNPEANKVEYTWFGTYSSETSFTVVYKVTVPGDASDGTYSFTGGQVEYYLGGTGPHFANTTSDTEVTIARAGSTENDSGVDNTGMTSSDEYTNTTGEGESGVDVAKNSDIENNPSDEFSFNEPEPEGTVADVAIPEIPVQDITITSPSLPMEESELPPDSQIPPPSSSTFSQQGIVIGIPVASVVCLILAFILMRRYKTSKENRY